jgi:hypothetical protein
MPRTPVLLALSCSGALAAQAPPAPQVAGWRADLRLLAAELPRRHPAPFVRITAAQWDSATTSLDRRLETLSRNQALVELARLVALIGDAHTVLQPDPSLGLRYYPLELYAFDDGVFVRRADSAHTDLVGAKVLRIGRVSADSALAAVATIVSHENDGWVRAWGPFQLMIPEMLDGLGLATDVERLPLVVERDGRRATVVVTPAGRITNHLPSPIDMSDWLTMRQAPAPLWEQRPDEIFWWTWLADRRTLYVCMRAVAPAPHANSNRPQWDAVFALADSVSPARFVIDIRENLGGNGFLNRYPVQQILRRPALDRPDLLFVIIGRRTFSAGQQFTNQLEWWTQATLVGEPTGQRPTQYGDHEPLALPHSRLTVQISTVFHQAPNPFDTRALVPPALYTPLTAGDYRRGVDPALAAILAADTMRSVGDRVAEAVAAGDTAGAERILREARAAVINRFRNLEGDINALGYRLLRSGDATRAIAVFTINTRVYPGSANTFDSLGEALLAVGRREESITAYRRALEIEPGFPPSLRALERLGVRD